MTVAGTGAAIISNTWVDINRRPALRRSGRERDFADPLTNHEQWSARFRNGHTRGSNSLLRTKFDQVSVDSGASALIAAGARTLVDIGGAGPRTARQRCACYGKPEGAQRYRSDSGYRER